VIPFCTTITNKMATRGRRILAEKALSSAEGSTNVASQYLCFAAMNAKVRVMVLSDSADGPKTGAPRRSSATVRAALLSAAAQVFADKGYAGASTKQIASLARTSEASIYRQFGSKAELFTAAVVGPFFEFLAEYEKFFEDSVATGGWTDEDLIAASVEQLFRHLLPNQNAMRALMTSHGDPESEQASRQAMRRIDDFFYRLNDLGRLRAKTSDGFDPAKLYLTHRFLVGLVFDVTALSAWFLPHGWDRPTERAMIDEVTNFVMYGFLGRPNQVRDH
jgi:AcrR family transcriptional regulator